MPTRSRSRCSASASTIARVAVVVLSGAAALAQDSGVFLLTRDHPAIQYSTRPTHDAIFRLNERIGKGELQLAFEAPPRGYLQSVLKALDISPASQTLVFSENSLQRAHISKATPRAIYFNDTVAVSWSKGADTVEATVLDATQGVHFYTIAQAPQQKAQFVRRTDCLECHLMPQTLGVPGLFVMSQLPLSDDPNEYAQGWPTDHRTPIEDRWGGWYVTGAQVPERHLGNVPVTHVPRSYVRADVAPKLAAGTSAFDTSAYLTPTSDVVALLVLNHQVHMTNLLIRLGWEARVAAHESARPGMKLPDVRKTARDVVDYMLFVGEAPLPSAVRGSLAFAQEFSARGPRDARGRSLRDLELTHRLFRYPCSYMIYTDAFESLPVTAKGHVYERLWEVLSGKETDTIYSSLSLADRRDITGILRDTKNGLPAYFYKEGQ
ncbi:MAG: hypothetical protein ND807_03665 [Vicinamibacterales bacterium]|nr:hypothetical protein [Vicinamibacterales bacterium]